MPQLVNADTCLSSKMPARQKWHGTLDGSKNKSSGRRLTPLFWDSDKNVFSDIWSARDPTGKRL